MNSIAFVIGAILMVMGFDWYRRSPVSAGRPASLLMLMGALGIIASLLTGCPAHADNNPFSGARSISVKMVRDVPTLGRRQLINRPKPNEGKPVTWKERPDH